MALNRRHAGGMKSAMENLKKIDERIAAALVSTNPSGVEATPENSGNHRSILSSTRVAWLPEDGDRADPPAQQDDDADALKRWPE